MLSDKEVLDHISAIGATLSKAGGIVRSNWLATPLGEQRHPSANDRAVIYEALDTASDLIRALYMELRAEDHPEITLHDCGHPEDEDCPF